MDNEITSVVYPSKLIGCIPDDLPTPDSEAFSELDEAQLRYYILNGIVDDDVISVELASADRAKFKHLRTRGSVDSRRMVDFMHQATGLPRGWCVTWMYLDTFSTLNAGALTVKDRDTFLAEQLREALGLLIP